MPGEEATEGLFTSFKANRHLRVTGEILVSTPRWMKSGVCTPERAFGWFPVGTKLPDLFGVNFGGRARVRRALELGLGRTV